MPRQIHFLLFVKFGKSKCATRFILFKISDALFNLRPKMHASLTTAFLIFQKKCHPLLIKMLPRLMTYSQGSLDFLTPQPYLGPNQTPKILTRHQDLNDNKVLTVIEKKLKVNKVVSYLMLINFAKKKYIFIQTVR